MNKKELTEADIRTKFITPALDKDKQGSWDLMTQLLEEHYFTKGRVLVRGKTVARGEAKKADYILFYKPNLPIAIIEAKDNHHAVGAGMQQALDYAKILDIPFAYSSNGDAFLEHDRTAGADPVEREFPLDHFPSPDELWKRYRASKGYTPDQEAVATHDYYDDGSGKKPRYYQLNAINRTVDASARGDNRILLVMATGTGKTYTAFQIIWRLWKSGAKKRIHYFGESICTYSLKQGPATASSPPTTLSTSASTRTSTAGARRPENSTNTATRSRTANTERDFDCNLVLEQRTALVAAKVTAFLNATSPAPPPSTSSTPSSPTSPPPDFRSTPR